MEHTVYLGLGSNLGDRREYLSRALEELSVTPGLTVLAASSIEETDPVDFLDQPRFLNQAVMAGTDLEARDLLARLLAIEEKLGRRRGVPKGPRTIDLDILLYGDVVCREGDLVLPHPGITARPFVMKHLLELDEGLADPATGIPYREVYRNGANKKHQ